MAISMYINMPPALLPPPLCSRKILAGDKEALNRYLELLESGGSDYPINLLKKAGVDMTSPEPINKTIELFGQLVDQMEKLLLE